RRYCVRAWTIVRGAFVIVAIIVPPAAAATLSDDSTTPSTTTARPLPLPIPDGGTKSSPLVFSNNVPMTSSSSTASSVARGGCTPPNLRTGELESSPSFPGLRLPPPPSTDAAPVDRSVAAAI
ncbi:hypothetical protein EDB86DRAFT_2907445, partial [Lactarius hatsudake]